MADEDTRREILLALAELYEKQDPRNLYQRIDFGDEGQGPYLQKLVAELRAEGSVEGKLGNIRFTGQGYNKYKSEIAAFREPRKPANIVGTPRLLFLGAGATQPLGKMLMGTFVKWLMNQSPPEPDLLGSICKEKPDLEFLLEELEGLTSKNYLAEHLEGFAKQKCAAEGVSYYKFLPEVFGFPNAAGTLLKWVKHQVFHHYRELIIEPPYQKNFEALLNLFALPDWPVVIFTTNYDPMVEEICRLTEAGWSLVDGFTSDPRVGEHYWDRRAFEEFNKGPGDKRIVLFKLHGSTTWTRLGRRILKSPPIYAGDDKMCENIMIFPSTRKVAIEDPFFTAYDYLEKCLGAAELCLCIGYSFRDYDTLMRFKAAKMSNPALQLCVLDPSAQSLRDALGLHGLDATPLPFVFGVQTQEYMEAVRKLAGKTPG
jgi:hypothetical protein